MAKGTVHQSRKNIATPQGNGQIIESHISLEDNILPSADEMEKYQKVYPNLVPFFMDSFKDEQHHRHTVEQEQVEVVRDSRKKDHREVIIGMIVAFICFFISMALMAWALYLDKDWIAGAIGAIPLGLIIKTFITRK